VARAPKGTNRKAPAAKARGRAPAQKPSNSKPQRGNRDTALEKLTERLVNLAGERKALGEDMADIYADAKDRGYDVKVLRRTVKVLSETAEQRSERERVEEESDQQLAALGALADTPLGQAARSASEGRSPPPKAAPPEPPRPTTEPPSALQ
jgi:uncharacterized protein (UPF0335 family)